MDTAGDDSTSLESSGLNLRPGTDDDGWAPPPAVSLSDGTRIWLHKDGQALHAAYEAIRNARSRVCLEVYIFRSDATGRAFAELLSAKAREGVKVYLIYDSFGSMGSRKLMSEMGRAGVRLAEFAPLRPWECRFSWRPMNRDHRKLLAVDDHLAGLGGLNIGDEYAGSWVAGAAASMSGLMRDNAIGIGGPGAAAVLRAFSKTWRYIHTGGRMHRTELMHNLNVPEQAKGRRLGKPSRTHAGPASMLTGQLAILASAPTLNSPLRPVLYGLVRGARKSISILMAYFAPDDELIIQLCAAARRGVRVRLILAGRSDNRILMIAARSFYARLLEAGAKVYERREAVLHAKTLVIDSHLSVVGSTNLDYRSTEFNLEISALIDSAEFGQQIEAMMDHDVTLSNQITPARWRARPTSDRVVQWAVSRARYLL